MADGRDLAVLQDVLNNGINMEAAEKAITRHRTEVRQEGFIDVFINPDTPGVTGVAGDKTILFIFSKGRFAEERADPDTGLVYATRRTHNAFHHRQSIVGAVEVGYRANVLESGRTTHDIIVWGMNDDIVAKYRDVAGLRKER